MEELIIRNFGPIKEVELKLNKVTILIGEQGSGKSCIAKLLAVLRNEKVMTAKPNIIEFSQIYNINNFFKEDTFISYKSKNYDLLYENGEAKLTGHDTEDINSYILVADQLSKFLKEEQDYIKSLDPSAEDTKQKSKAFQLELSTRVANFMKIRKSIMKPPVYIPAERIFISSISNSLYGLANSQISLPKCITEFGSQFETARTNIGIKPIEFLKLSYQFENQIETIILEDHTRIQLSEASSGIQACLPMILVIEQRILDQESKSTFVVEEPESNLYPVNQKHLTYFLVEKCTKLTNDLIITTHSPFVLRAFNICLQAYKSSTISLIAHEKVSRIIPESSWLNPDYINAYFIAEGGARQIFNDKTGQICLTDLDDIINQIDGDLDTLMGYVRGEGL